MLEQQLEHTFKPTQTPPKPFILNKPSDLLHIHLLKSTSTSSYKACIEQCINVYTQNVPSDFKNELDSVLCDCPFNLNTVPSIKIRRVIFGKGGNDLLMTY